MIIKALKNELKSEREKRQAHVVTAGGWQFKKLAPGQRVIQPSGIEAERAKPPAAISPERYSKQEIGVRIFAEQLFNGIFWAGNKGPQFS